MRKGWRVSIFVALFLLFLCASIIVALRFWPASNAGERVSICNPAVPQGTGTALPTAQMPPLYLGLDAYRQVDKLSYLEIGDRVEGASTADTDGSNADNTHIARVLPDGERVLFDQIGRAHV